MHSKRSRRRRARAASPGRRGTRVTQGAVSHQVKALEAEFGLRLFNRERQRLVITDAGRAYLIDVRDAFDRFSPDWRSLQRQIAGVLDRRTSPNFAASGLTIVWPVFAEVQMAGASARPLRRRASRRRPPRQRLTATHRLRARGHRPRDSPQRRAMAGASARRLCAEKLFPGADRSCSSGRSACASRPISTRPHVPARQ